MDYIKLYNSIISSAVIRNSKKDGSIYLEEHHIKPASMCKISKRYGCIDDYLFDIDADTEDNLVNLTLREHFMCHYLLYKIYPDSREMQNAFYFMSSRSNNVNSKSYEICKKNHIANLTEINKSRIWTPEQRQNASINRTQLNKLQCGENHPLFGKIHPNNGKKIKCGHTKDGLARISLFAQTRHYSNETKLKMSISRTGKKHSADTIEKIKNSNTAEVRAAKAKGGLSQKGKPKPKVVCPHCGKEGGSGLMHRWHFNNCKHKV